MTQPQLVGASLEAMVGTTTTGAWCSMVTALAASTVLPPPMPTTTSAPASRAVWARRFHFTMRAFPAKGFPVGVQARGGKGGFHRFAHPAPDDVVRDAYGCAAEFPDQGAEHFHGAGALDIPARRAEYPDVPMIVRFRHGVVLL